MRGPAPKPAAQRRRRNAVAGIETLPAETPLKRLRCPSSDGMVKEWWGMLWASPMSKAWTVGDAPSLLRLAICWERFLGGAQNEGAILAIEDRLGLSPLARRRLQWEITKGAGQAAADAANGPLPVDDMRRRLKAVP